MKNFLTSRLSYFTGFILIIGLLSAAFIIEFQKGILPCPLCVLQRLLLIILGALFLVGMIFQFKKWGHLFLGLIGCLVSLAGIIFSARQVWLQHAPPVTLGDCGISLSYIFRIFSFKEAMQVIWRGGVECATQSWAFLQLSIAEWSLIWFFVFFIFIFLQMKRALK